jgi:4-hydroxybenzoate polyprenyltransferase
MNILARFLVFPIVLAVLLVWTVVYQSVKTVGNIIISLFTVTVIMLAWAITGEQV